MRVIGFLDGRLYPMARPSLGDEEVCYNGKERVHGLKYLFLAAPDGMVSHVIGPVEGRHHDAWLTHFGDFENVVHRLSPPNTSYSVLADVAFGNNSVVATSYRENEINNDPDKSAWNRIVYVIRVAVEWSFNKFLQLWNKFFVDTRNLRLHLMPLGRLTRVGVILLNAYVCLNGSQTSSYFSCLPPSLSEYFRR